MVDTVKGYRGGRYGFIRTCYQQLWTGIFVSLVFMRRLLTISAFSWALLNSYTRIYLGVHFISDIVAGILVGSLLGMLTYLVYSWIRVKVVQPVEGSVRHPYTKNGTMLASFIIICLIIITVFSPFLETIPH